MLFHSCRAAARFLSSVPQEGRLCYIHSMRKVSLAEKLGVFDEHLSPRIVGELNGQHVKLVKFQGEFVWHHHDWEDELFLVVHGSFRLDYRDESGDQQSLEIGAGGFVIVPLGTEHRPYAAEEVHVLLFEPAGTLNTGNFRTDRTVDTPQAL
jgi:mannose-6-phosphate isomerase-like protein (cupin superfamily)